MILIIISHLQISMSDKESVYMMFVLHTTETALFRLDLVLLCSALLWLAGVTILQLTNIHDNNLQKINSVSLYIYISEELLRTKIKDFHTERL